MVGAASAQVTITGGIAVGIQNVMGTATANWHMTNADISFAAKEDLGGGLSVSAGTSISNEAGTGTKWGSGSTAANNTSITLAGGFGSMTYMNIISPAAKMGGPSAEDDLTDVLGGYSLLNIAAYRTPELMSGLTVGIEWVGQQDSDLRAGGTPYLVGYYNAGPANVYLSNGGAGKNWDLRVSYNAGMATVGVRATKEKRTEFGISVPAGAVTYSFNTVADNKDSAGIKGSGVSVAYALSKRTSMTFGYVSSSKSASTLNSGNGGNNYRLNLAHSF